MIATAAAVLARARMAMAMPHCWLVQLPTALLLLLPLLFLLLLLLLRRPLRGLLILLLLVLVPRCCRE
jgi:hypothetical protein